MTGEHEWVLDDVAEDAPGAFPITCWEGLTMPTRSTRTQVVDLYAGAGGWDEGMRGLGITDVVGIEIDTAACNTATAAGHRRLPADVAAVPVEAFTGCWGLVASPPCQAWSMAGQRRGEADRERVHALIDRYAAGRDDIGDGWADDRSHHAAQPVRWVRDLRPEWVCMEQVPPVLPLWEHVARVLRRWGYSTWTGVLNAADYGVPQTRQRAFLIATAAGTARPPAPTHSQDPGGSDLFGTDLLPWVSMAEALGWDGAVRTGQVSTLGRGRTQRYERDTSRPAPTLMANTDRWQLAVGARSNATTRDLGEPAPTILCSRTTNVSWVSTRPATTVAGDPRIAPPGHRDRAGGERQHANSIRVSLAEAAVLQGFPADYPWNGTKTKQFLQVGNAVPPPLAGAVIASAAGLRRPSAGGDGGA